jgi:hypothetical protein
MTGPIILQGPHQGAQKSTTTGKIGFKNFLVETGVGDFDYSARNRLLLRRISLLYDYFYQNIARLPVGHLKRIG